MASINKQDLASKIAEATGSSTSQAKETLETTLDLIAGELASGNEVALAGFGKFSVSQRAAREGRNPRTGETVQIAASNAAKFSAASALKQRLN